MDKQSWRTHLLLASLGTFGVQLAGCAADGGADDVTTGGALVSRTVTESAGSPGATLTTTQPPPPLLGTLGEDYYVINHRGAVASAPDSIRSALSAAVTAAPSGALKTVAATANLAAGGTTLFSAFWSYTGYLHVPRSGHTATLLADGRVLVYGGTTGEYPTFTTLSSAEIYDPGTGRWTDGGSTFYAREGNTATLLQNGNVIVVGGAYPFNTSVEMYIPSRNAWFATGRTNIARGSHTATLLRNGKVLIAGGLDPNTSFLSSAELYDPVSQTWSMTGAMNHARYGHTATLLSDGRVLVAGGGNGFDPAAATSAELYDPATGLWTVTDLLSTSRFGHSATGMADGRVLIAGGLTSDSYHNFSLSKVEGYNPPLAAFYLTTNMNVARRYHTSALLPDGKVLVVGGTDNDLYSGGYQHLASTEVYDPVTQTWTTFGTLNVGRFGNTTTLLRNGQVLVVGGASDASASLASAELFDSSITCSTITITPSTLSAAFVNVAYRQALDVWGSAVFPNNWQVISGALPPGLSLNTTTGVISGTPTATGSFAFMMQASAGNCLTKYINYTLSVGVPRVRFPVTTVTTTATTSP
jgi:N-acetylneuraminic acid mutarotase